MPAELYFAAGGLGDLPVQIATSVLAFLVVLIVLTKVAWNPIIKLLDERRQTIADEFSTMERKQAELNSRMKDLEERLRLIDNERRETLNQAIEDGRKQAAGIVEDARVQVDEMRRKAQTDIRIETEKARETLRNDVVNLAIGATRKLIKAELNDERSRQLVVEFVNDLGTRS